MFTVYPPFGASLCCGFHMTLKRIGFVCESCWGSCTTSFGRVMSVLCWEPVWRLSCKECFGKQSWITVGLPTSSYQNLCVLESRMPGNLEIFGTQASSSSCCFSNGGCSEPDFNLWLVATKTARSHAAMDCFVACT